MNRLYHTVRELRPVQVIYRLKYLFKRKYVSWRKDSVYRKYLRKSQITGNHYNPDPRFTINSRRHYTGVSEAVLNNTITFLNHEIRFGQAIQWHREELNKGTRLWKLNLQYHEFLIDIAAMYNETADKKYLSYLQDTIEGWYLQNPLGTKGYGKDNWNSYAISLRLIAWIKIFNMIHESLGAAFKERFITSLKIQAAFLYDNLEYDILGNHLIKNWKALYWCGEFLNEERYIKKARQLFYRHIVSQFTKAGMHEELSPMYAGIVLEDLVEVYLFRKDDEELGELIRRQYQCLQSLTYRDEYLFLNDSVYNNGVQPVHLDAFYNKAVATSRQQQREEYTFEFDGYIGFKSEREYLVFDAGPMVAGVQPGHGHCDTLSFEYYRNGRKFFTNSGTYEYNSGRRRTYSRSTQAHNTLKYGDYDQSEIWASFRVARRAEAGYNILEHAAGLLRIDGWVRGFDFSRRIIHERSFEKSGNKICIRDKVESFHGDETRSSVYLHLAPGFTFIHSGKGISIINEGEEVEAFLSVNRSFSLIETEFYPEFGKCLSKSTLRIEGIKPGEICHTEISFSNA